MLVSLRSPVEMIGNDLRPARFYSLPFSKLCHFTVGPNRSPRWARELTGG
jgi:hypothetical protein